MKNVKHLCLLTSALLLISFHSYSQNNSGIDFKDYIDNSIDPGNDFFKYATGNWMKNNPIPASESAWTIAHLVMEENYTRIKTILEEASGSNAEKETSNQKVGDFYFSGMDSSTIEELDVKPLAKELELINSIKNKEDLFKAAALLKREQVGVMFSLFVDQDAKNSEQYALYLYQGGLGLPNREYYFREDARTENIRSEYKIHLENMVQLLGDNTSAGLKSSADIYNIESFLADSSRKLEDLRDPYLNYNKMSLAELKKLTPGIDWENILSSAGITNINEVIVGQPEFFKQLNAAVNKFSLSQWRTYLKWHLINSFASYLSSKFDKEQFHFRGTVISGTTEQRPRWKRIQDDTENQLGELLGQVYVKKYYSDKTKKRYEKLVDDIIEAFRDRIKKLDWMSDPTKEKAMVKLNSIRKKVGYPDKWKDFSRLNIERGTFARNNINANIFWFEYMIGKLGKPVDRLEWFMTPQTYNAYYNPSNNEIVLPAAIFIIPGVPDSLLDDAIIYSYAGASTIGHELTHGFDDQGRQFDTEGNLSPWWTKEDEEKFNKRAELMIEQFNNYIVLDSMNINGSATVGENIADLGGVVTGYDAFMKTAQYKEGKTIDGFTPSQRFWLGYALSWLGHRRPESLARQVMTDVHSPNFLRINGPLSNIPAFYEDFDVKEEEPMYRPPEKRVEIW